MLSSTACDNRDRGKSSSQNAARTVEGSCRCRSDRPNSRNYQIDKLYHAVEPDFAAGAVRKQVCSGAGAHLLPRDKSNLAASLAGGLCVEF